MATDAQAVRVERLRAAVAAMPEGPSRDRFAQLLAELADATPPPSFVGDVLDDEILEDDALDDEVLDDVRPAGGDDAGDGPADELDDLFARTAGRPAPDETGAGSWVPDAWAQAEPVEPAVPHEPTPTAPEPRLRGGLFRRRRSS